MRCTFFTSLAIAALFAEQEVAAKETFDDETALYQKSYEGDNYLAQLDSGLLADDLDEDDLAEVDANSTDWGPFAAGAVLVSLPVMTLFFLLQKHLVGGLTAGSVKG